MARESALTGIRVVEFGQYVAAPLLGMLLADQGAEVIKVERPEGDPMRGSPAFAVWNRGKKSVVLDLKSDPGLESARDLVQNADVLLENFRPAVMNRLGLGYDAFASSNPLLIYVSQPGFGPKSPYRNLPAWETLVAAATATYRAPIGREAGDPVFTTLPLSSIFSAIIGAGAVTAALLHRGHTGQGQYIEVPLQDATVVAIGQQMVRHVTPGGEFIPRLGLPNMGTSGMLQAGDGRYLNSTVREEHEIRRMLEAAGHPEWIEPLLADRASEEPEAISGWIQRMAELIRSRPGHEWDEMLGSVVPVVLCRTIEEWMESQQAIESQMMVTVQDPVYGPMKQAGLQVRLSESPGAIRGPAPALGTHTQEIQAELKKPKSRSQRRNQGRRCAMKALEGVRVIDVSYILAAPTAGRVLAEYGAEVIKVNNPDRVPNRTHWVEANRGKLTIMVDLKAAEGRRIFYDLVQTADIVVDNFRLGVAERLGVDYEKVRIIKPDIIYATVSAFGWKGPWADHPGYEPQGQAVSGIQVRNGGRDGVPGFAPFPVNDYGTGISCAWAAMLALLERERTGKGQHVHTALSYSATTIQSGLAVDYPGFQRHELEGPQVKGYHALDHLYQVSDGWIALVVAGQNDWESLVSLSPFAHLAQDPQFTSPQERRSNDGTLVECLALIFKEMSAREALDLLSSGGVPAVKNTDFSTLYDDLWFREAGLIARRYHGWLGDFDHPSSVGAYLSQTLAVLGAPPPFIGADTTGILTALLGYSDEKVADLVNQGVIDTHQVPSPYDGQYSPRPPRPFSVG